MPARRSDRAGVDVSVDASNCGEAPKRRTYHRIVATRGFTHRSLRRDPSTCRSVSAAARQAVSSPRPPYPSRLRRILIATGSVAGTAFVGLVIADVYGRLTDDAPDRPLTAVAEAATACPGGSFVVPAALLEDLPPSTALDSACASTVASTTVRCTS